MKNRIRYAFRRPVFPIVGQINGHLIGATSPSEFQAAVDSRQLPPDAHFPIVDSRAEGWDFMTHFLVVSPLTFKKRWTKKDIVELFNGSQRSTKEMPAFLQQSLSNWTVQDMIKEIVATLRVPTTA